ncbi:MAG: hypothetical protein EAX81_08485 [Candidatus Thorarchaeota archaeon]|nr:hypothetical protein [Candidatus Thorarchaeota archaeon]
MAHYGRPVFYDPVYKANICLDALEMDIIHCAELERLRRIRQLSVADIVYPHAKHTRFEHSIGTNYLTKVIMDRLQFDLKTGYSITHDDIKQVGIAALIHDIGHSALGYAVDRFLDLLGERKSFTDKHVAKMMLCGEIELEVAGHRSIPRAVELLEKYESRGLAPQLLSQIITGNHPEPSKMYIANLICSEVDVDRMDYIIRDAYNTIPFALYDLEGIMSNLRVRDVEGFHGSETPRILAISFDGVPSVESMFASEAILYRRLYSHRLVRILHSMASRALFYARDEYKPLLQAVWLRTDDGLLQDLASCSIDNSRRIAGDIINGCPYYVSDTLSYGYSNMSYEARSEISHLILHPDTLLKLEQELADAVDLGIGEVIVDVMPRLRSSLPDYLMPVILPREEGLVDLREVSYLAHALVPQKTLQALPNVIVGFRVDDKAVAWKRKQPSKKVESMTQRLHGVMTSLVTCHQR